MGKVAQALKKSGKPKDQDVQKNEQGTISPDMDKQVDQQASLPGDAAVEQVEKTPKNTPVFETSAWDERLLNSTRNNTGVAEGVRKIRTILFQETRKPIRSVMVLSADPHEGKSFVCANLGISIAKGVEHEALLVDCDLRRPSLHTLFGVNVQQGLADFLNLENNGEHLILPTGQPKLSLIASGRPPGNPAELLSTGRMANLIDELTGRKRNRIVVLDTPPFYAASETILLSQLVDKIVIVVRWGKSGREQIKKMIDTIGREKILGIVFNAFEMNFLDKKIQGVGYANYYSEYY